jgi:hypothetical protein
MNNRLLHTTWYRQRLTLLAYGHAMPSALLLCGDSAPIGISGFGSDAVLIAPITFVAHGNNVPISRGDPPLLQE